MRYLLLFLMVGFITTVQNRALAVVTPVTSEVNTENDNLAVINPTKKEAAKKNKLLEKFNKKLNKINAKRIKKGKKAIEFDLTDPVDKWFWFWLGAWAAALILVNIPGIRWLGGLAGLAGFVFLVIWLVNRFA